MKDPISITAISSLSAVGGSQAEIWEAYLDEDHRISEKKFDNFLAFVAEISPENNQKIANLRNSDANYKNLDISVLFAIFTARNAIKKAGWTSKDNFGVNIGSSRGATQLFEKYHREFINSSKSSTLSSPTTTLGNISSWVAHDLQTDGPEISHSITCSTGLHSLLNGVAWLQSGMAKKFLIGGSETALTPFTISQMQALKIYAKPQNSDFPCRAFDLKKKQNTLVLGEGSTSVCLEKDNLENALARIIGIGYATEILQHSISISADAQCFQKSMKMALGNFYTDEIDAIVMHAPGTIKGDTSEFEAIKKVFGNKIPFLTTNKWKLGHTFATSGLLSLELAVLMLAHQQEIAVPFAKKQTSPKQLKKILVNAVGFGGNAVSVLLMK